MSAIFLCVALSWAGAYKVFARSAPLAAAQSGIPLLAYRALGVVELAAAVAVFVSPLAATPLALGFLVFLGYRKLTKPAASCGCTSARQSPIGVRHFARAGLLLAASLISPAVSLLVALAVSTLELVIYCALSPDLDPWWLYPLRRMWIRLSHPLAGATTDEIPLHATVQQLQRSETFRQVGGLLRSDVVESWEDGDWRILRYTIGYQGELADAVFAVPRLTDEPERVKFAIVSR